MRKNILLALLILFAVVLSTGLIYASDVNAVNSNTTYADDTGDISLPIEDNNLSSSSLESDSSNTLSKDSGDNNLLGDDDISKTVTAKDVTKYYKGSAGYSAKFYNLNGSLLTGSNVKIIVNGITYSKATDLNGEVSLSFDLKPGNYKVVAVNPATGYNLTSNFKVLSTIKANDISKVYSDTRKFTATFYKSTGKVLSNTYVKFKINGKTYKVKTNSKGVAGLALKSLKKGTYKIISYSPDGLTCKNTVKVVKSTTTTLTTQYYTFLKCDSSKKIKVKLLNKFGYAPGKGKVVKFTVNGKTYSKKTNANGIATLKLPTLKKGIYTVKYKFAGNSFYKSSSATNKVAIIPSKTATFTIQSPTSFTNGTSSTFKLQLTSGGVALYKKTVKFTLNNKTYTKTTNSKGVASLTFKLGIGKYPVSYSLVGDSVINSKVASTTIYVKEKSSIAHNGYWLFASDMQSVNLGDLASQGVTDIFLNFKAYENNGKSGVESWVASAKSNGISVHLWTQVFYQSNVWTNPVVNGKLNTEFFTQKIDELKKYAAIKGLAGIHMDYLRYPGTAYKTSGGTSAITSFVSQAVTAINSVNPNLIVSAAIMPEKTDNTYYYGQNFTALSQLLDVIIPMIYKGNYNAATSWITSTTKWFVTNSKGASIWSGIQTYESDEKLNKLSVTDLTKDVNAAYSGGANGVVLFRYGFTNYINFNSLAAASSDTSLSKISINNIIAGANTIKSYYASNKKIPSSVTAGGKTFTMPEFLYLMGKAICQLSNSDNSDIGILSGISAPASPTGDSISADLAQDDYITVAKNLVNFISSNKRAPNYATSSVGKIIYSEVVDAFSRILAFYPTDNRLPNYCTITYTSSSTTGTGLNEKNTISDLSSYYKSSKNCQVGNSKIKSLVNSLTKGLTSAKAKATAIYNYVRDSISYTFYSNTKYGALGTYNAKNGNCVDQAHLLVAMFRTAGLAARYVHGTCKFTSGSTYGHVWAQVLVDGVWMCADPTSSKNSLGKISNWNTKTFTLKGKYVSLSF